MPTANMIAFNIVSEKFDIVVSISTPGLQVMANANKEGKVLQEPQQTNIRLIWLVLAHFSLSSLL